MKNEYEEVLNIEAGLYKAVFEDEKDEEEIHEELENIPRNISGMRALLNFCESYDYQLAYEYLLEEDGMFQKLAIEHEYYRFFNLVVRARDMFDDYVHYEVKLEEFNCQRIEENEKSVEVEIRLIDLISKVLDEEELENVKKVDTKANYIPEKRCIKIEGNIINNNAFDFGILFMYNVEKISRDSLYTDAFRFRIDGNKSKFILYVPVIRYDIEDVGHVTLIPYLY